ncbi:MAG TPA: glycosyltransferase family 4 protein, partial [Limnochordales bacterium]
MRGGMITHVAALLKGLAACGVQVAVLGHPESLAQLRQRLARVGAEGACSTWLAVPVCDGFRPAQDVRAVRALVRAINRLRPALVHAHGLKASVLAAAALACPAKAASPTGAAALVCAVHGPLPSRQAAWQGRWEAMLAGWALREAAAVVVVSRGLADELVRWMGGRLEVRKLAIVPNGLDPDWVGPPEPACPARAGTGRARGLIATCMSRLTRVKGVEVLLRAAALVDRGLPLRFWVVGDGPDRERLVRLARQLKLAGRVRLLGFQLDPQRVWGRSDIAVVPSEAEGFSYAALE